MREGETQFALLREVAVPIWWTPRRARQGCDTPEDARRRGRECHRRIAGGIRKTRRRSVEIKAAAAAGGHAPEW